MFNNKIELLLMCLLLFVFAQFSFAATTTIVSYEPSESSLIVSSSDIQSRAKVLGGLNGAPFATDGEYVLKLSWTGQTDRKVEVYHGGLSYNLFGFEKILIDIYIPSGSALFDSGGVIGFWSANWLPGNWTGGDSLPTATDKWFTIKMDISSFNTGNLSFISALIFENYAADEGTVYIDNIRLVNDIPGDVAAAGADKRIDIDFSDVQGYSVEGYDIYRSTSDSGTFTKINSYTYPFSFYSDYIGDNNQTYYYKVKTKLSGGYSDYSDTVSATTYQMTDAEFLTSVQQVLFRYHWDFAHPVSGLSYDCLWYGNPSGSCSLSGSGFGVMNIVVAAERGYITRLAAAKHILKTLTFLEEKVSRYHGAFAHFVDGRTGETIPFSEYDDAADIVETAFMLEGILTARQYFDGTNPTETSLRQKATELWEAVDWYWFLRRSDTGYEDNESMFWHWSPNYGWYMDLPVRGYNETMMVYLLGIASPTHPIPASCYHNGYAVNSDYINANTYYGYRQWVGAYGFCLFFSHYSQMAFDPRNKTDRYCNYFENSRNVALIHRAYAEDNPKNFVGHSDLVWGLTASADPWGYSAPYIPNDNGTIPPTAAISCMPYTPTESTAMMRHIYDTYGSNIWGPLGFTDAFNLTENWFADGYIAIDQGPMAIMLENHLSGLCWDLFMSNPEIAPMMEAVGFHQGLISSRDITSNVSQGLDYEYYEGSFSSVSDFASLSPAASGTVNNFSLTPRLRDENFGFRYTGYMNIPADGTYYFYLTSDDGSQLYIDDVLVVDNDGAHSTESEVRGAIGLESGLVPITVLYFQATGSRGLLIRYEGPSTSKQLIANSSLYRCDLTGDLTGDCHVDAFDLEQFASQWLAVYDFYDYSELLSQWQR